MRHRPSRQRWAAQILMATHGGELTRLKAYVDDGGDYHTMYKLCYFDLQACTAFYPIVLLDRNRSDAVGSSCWHGAGTC